MLPPKWLYALHPAVPIPFENTQDELRFLPKTGAICEANRIEGQE